MSDESVGPRAPVGACFNLLSLSEKGQERSKSCWASSPASIHPSSVELSLSIGRSALRQALLLPSGVSPSIGISVFHRAFRAPSASPSSVGHSAFRRVLISAIRRPLSVPPPVERFALRQDLLLPSGVPPSVGLSVFLSGYPSSVGRSALHRGLRLPSDISMSVEFSILAISRILSVSPSFERFEDCVLITPTGTPSAI